MPTTNRPSITFRDAALAEATRDVRVDWQRMHLALLSLAAEARRGRGADIRRLVQIAEDARRIFNGDIASHLPCGVLDGGGIRTELAHRNANDLMMLLARIVRVVHSRGGVADLAEPCEARADWINASLRPLYGTDWASVTLPTPEAARLRSSRGMTRQDAERRARQLLEDDPDFHARTARAWSQAIGCSVGLVCELTSWKAVQEGKRRSSHGKPPRAVALTPQLLATTDGSGRRGASADATQTPEQALADLIDEQERDRRARRVHKTL